MQSEKKSIYIHRSRFVNVIDLLTIRKIEKRLHQSEWIILENANTPDPLKRRQCRNLQHSLSILRNSNIVIRTGKHICTCSVVHKKGKCGDLQHSRTSFATSLLSSLSLWLPCKLDSSSFLLIVTPSRSIA